MSGIISKNMTASSCFHPLKISFADFQTLYAKSKGTKLNQLWCRQLRQVDKISAFLNSRSLVVLSQRH